MNTINPLVVVNGVKNNHLSIRDRGLAFGDGLFETLRVDAGDMPLWRYHYQRLHQGLGRLGIRLDVDILLNHICVTMESIANRSGVLKIIVTRGESARGYMPTENGKPTLVSVFTALSEDDWQSNQQKQAQGVEVHQCQTRLPLNRALAGLKTLNQLNYVLATMERQELSAEEGLLFSENGLLIEATARNVFIVKDGKILTPLLNQCGVEGVLKQCLREICDNESFVILEKELKEADVLSADEVLLSNSISGIWPVIQYGEKYWQPGDITQALQRKITQSLVKSSVQSWVTFISTYEKK